MMATQSTTAFALGVLALAPGGAHIDTRPGRGGSRSSTSGRGRGTSRCARRPADHDPGGRRRRREVHRFLRETLRSRSLRSPTLREDAIKGGVVGFLEAMDQSLSGELVTVVTYMPWCRSCHHLRHRLRVLAEAHALAGSGAMFYEIDLNANPEVHKMLDIHATPTVLLYCSGQLVDEFTCAGDSGPRVMLKHIEEQVGSIPDPWHRIRGGPSPESPTPGTTSSVPDTEDDA